MLTFSTDPEAAEQQMRAVIFYLTAFGYVDGELDATEKRYVRDFAGKIVIDRARAALGDKLDAHYEMVERWIQHFHEMVDEIDHQIQDLFTESVAEGESTTQFVIAKLKLRCFELFRRFDDHTRSEMLASVDELMFADGTVHPNEEAFRRELYQLLLEPVEIDEEELEAIEAGTLVIGAPAQLAAAQADHPFFISSERPYAKDKESFAREAQGDMELIDRVLDTLDRMRAEGKGRLGDAFEVTDFPDGSRFLDGHVFVNKPAADTRQELLVIGDLHGCYSCLKAALLQADFFGKVEAHKADPVKNPPMSLVLLGDYIDRGRFSYNGVLRAVMQLFTAMPENVYLLRGNHEYYVEINGKVMAPVRPCEAMNEIAHLASKEIFAKYMRLFEALPTSLIFDRTLFVHAGIPREDTLADKWSSLESLNDPDIRFQMLWSDPSEADSVPLDLQKANARFPFGRKQLKSFLGRLGARTLIRGHEKVNEGFRKVYDDPEATLLTLFSAGGATNEDLPKGASYREVTPMALSIRYDQGVSEIVPFAIDYARFNDPKVNAFFREQIATPAPPPVSAPSGG
ncbi:MAG: metallophosphoesterase family protein [Byssovorax sp.]